MYCKTCKHFEEPSLRGMRFTPTGWGVCGLSRGHDGMPVIPEAKAVAIDFEEYSAYLTISPDFGCVQYQAVS